MIEIKKQIMQSLKIRLDILSSIDWNDLDDNELFIAMNNCEEILVYLRMLIEQQ